MLRFDYYRRIANAEYIGESQQQLFPLAWLGAIVIIANICLYL